MSERQRCFLAIPIDPAAVDVLCSLQPMDEGLRRVPPEQLHITLHFLGEQDVAAVIDAVSGIEVVPFDLHVRRLGTFEGRGGDPILWAGIEPSAPLQALHHTLGVALGTLGFQPESRPYRPHITLGRAKSGYDVAPFLAADAPVLDIAVRGFELLASEFVDGRPVYTVIQSFWTPPPS